VMPPADGRNAPRKSAKLMRISPQIRQGVFEIKTE